MVFSKFDSLSLRPPTPPKDIKETEDDDINEAVQFLSDPFGTSNPPTKKAVKQLLLNTPEQSPSSQPGTASSSSNRKKRVNFDIPTCPAPTNGLAPSTWTPLRSSPLRPLPQTRVSVPLKSILKPSDPTSSPPPLQKGAAAHKFESVADMLESVVKMLAQGARPSKLDAYINLQKTLAAYENFPDVQSLVDKMPLLSDYIERDMQAVGINGSGTDSQLIGQAIKLFIALIRLPELRLAMTDDFCSRIIERIIKVIEDPAMPKIIINVHLALLAQQMFRPRLMTPSRVERIIIVMDSVHDRVSGYSVQAYRIRIYRKLIQQRPDLMVRHAERWMKHTIKAMLSSTKDIHQSALDTALTALKSIGQERAVTKSVLFIMNRTDSEGRTFGALFSAQLESMLNSDLASLVPQIWGVLTACLRESLQENKFACMGDWLKVLENILCHDNELVKLHAIIASNFLVYALNLSESTAPLHAKILFNISQHRFNQTAQVKKPNTTTSASGYFTLLYYALRPTASHAQLDRYWSEYVADFWRPHIRQPKHVIAACRLLLALFQGSRRPWDEQRALELKASNLIQRQELPLLDPKWVRKNLSKVLQFVESLLDGLPLNPEVGEDEPVKTMWIALLDSLVEASSKEIMASTETRDAIAHIVNMLRRMWDRHTIKLAMPQHKEDSWADKFCFLLENVVEKLGALQFTDKCLLRNGQDEIQVASTPSHRSRQHGPRLSPLLYFVDLLISRSEGRLSDPVRLRVVQVALGPCFNAQNTRLGKLELLRDCAVAVDPTLRNIVASNFWSQIASLTKSCLEQHPSDTNERQSRQLGKEYDIVNEILALGSSYLLTNPCGQDIIPSFVETVRKEAGDGAVVLAVVEKVSEVVLSKASPDDRRTCLPYITILLNRLPKNVMRRVLDQGRHNLYPSSPAPARTQEFDPYNHLYTAINTIGTAAYLSLDVEHIDSTRDFLDSLGTSIKNSPTFLFAVFLRKIQDTLKVWIEDLDDKLKNKHPSAKKLQSEVENLWRTICNVIEKLPRKDSSMLVTLEPLITAGFVSRRRSIVNISINMWNCTFGKEESLRYPVRLETALRRLYHTVDLSLPTLEAREIDKDDQASFYESDSEGVETPRTAKSPSLKGSAFRISKSAKGSRSKTRSPVVSTASAKQRSSRRSSKVRLRHEDSQILFEPIVSSPGDPFNQESQILTERQKEMIERQRGLSNMFTTMSATPSSQSDVQSPKEHVQEPSSDAMSADGLPHEESRTPLKTLAAMGPMDAYLGSSPTPRARTRGTHTQSDTTSIATPSAGRSLQVADDSNELGSSPPQFTRHSQSAQGHTAHDSRLETSNTDFEHRQRTEVLSDNFDEEIRIDESILADERVHGGLNGDDNSESELLMEEDMDDVPSSTMELQVNAQLNAELSAHSDNAETSILGDTLENSHLYVDAQPQPPLSNDVPTPQDSPDVTGKDTNEALDHSSTSRVGDSFSSPADENISSTPKSSEVRRLRRSSRHSTTPSQDRHMSTNKRKESPVDTPSKAKRSKKVKKGKENGSSNEETQPEEYGTADEAKADDDCIAVWTPEPAKSSRTRSQGASQTNPSKIMVPETNRKRSIRRSTSLLSQVEAVDDFVVEDTPAPKSARKSKLQDISEARTTPPQDSTRPIPKRLSHVRVSPRKNRRTSSSPLCKSSPAAESEKDEEGDTTIADTPSELEPEHTFSPIIKQDPTNPPSSSSLSSSSSSQPSQSSEVETSKPQLQSQPPATTTSSQPSITERVILTPRSILQRLRKMVSDCKDMVLGREEERAFDDVLFDLRTEVHAAGARARGRGEDADADADVGAAKQ